MRRVSNEVLLVFLQLETLKLGWCKLGEGKGAQAIADLLLFNQTLAVLDLRGNGLGNPGAAALSAALKGHTNEQLTELDIGYNEIKDDGACSVAQVRSSLSSHHTILCVLCKAGLRSRRLAITTRVQLILTLHARCS